MREIRFKLKEKDSYQYIYVDSNNRVHVFLPVSPIGNNITTNNTCKTAAALRQLMGGDGISRFVTKYIEDLREDLAIIPEGALRQEKQSRLTQLEHYQNLLRNLQIEPHVSSPNGGGPQATETLLASAETNCALMFFCPPSPDRYLSIQPYSNAVMFGMDRSSSGFGAVLNAGGLYNSLSLQRFMLQLCQQIQTRYNADPSVTVRDHVTSNADSNLLLRIMREVMAAQGYPQALGMFPGDTSTNASTNTNISADNPYTYEYYRNIIAYDIVGTRYALTEFLGHVMNSGKQEMYDFFKEMKVSLFAALPGAGIICMEGSLSAHAKVSMLVQFFLGVACVDYCEHLNVRENLGRKIEELTATQQISLLASIQRILGSEVPEEGLLDLLANHQPPLFTQPQYFKDDTDNQSRDRTKATRERIRSKFVAQWNTICTRETPHYDDFIVYMPDKVDGKFAQVTNTLCVHLADHCQAYEGIFGSLATTNAALYREYFSGNAPRLSKLQSNDPIFTVGPSSNLQAADIIRGEGSIALSQVVTQSPAIIAGVLTADSIDFPGKAVFETLTWEECEYIKSQVPSGWNLIRESVNMIAQQKALFKFAEYTTGSEARTTIQANVPRRQEFTTLYNNKFALYFGQNSSIVITRALEKALFDTYLQSHSFDDLYGKTRKEKLHEILNRTIFAGHSPTILPYQVVEKANGELVVVFAQDQMNLRLLLNAQVPQILGNYDTSVLITDDMAASLYAHANMAINGPGTIQQITEVLNQVCPGKQILTTTTPNTPDVIVVTANADNRGFTLKCTNQSIIDEVKAAIAQIYQPYCRYTLSQQEVNWLITVARKYNKSIDIALGEQGIRSALEVCGIDYISNIELTADGGCQVSIPEHAMRTLVPQIIDVSLDLLKDSARKMLEKDCADILLKAAGLTEPRIDTTQFSQDVRLVLDELIEYSRGLDELSKKWGETIKNSVLARTTYNEKLQNVRDFQVRMLAFETIVANAKELLSHPPQPPEVIPAPPVVVEPLVVVPTEEVALPLILKPILLSAAVGLGCSALAMGIVVPSILGLTGPITPIYATVIGGMILGIGMGILYASNEKDLNGRVLVFYMFGPLGNLGHTVFVSCLGSGLLELVPYLASAGLAPEMATGILIGGTFGITVICDMLAYTLLKQNDVQLFA